MQTFGPQPKEIVLLCNPRAGGRWKVLADILDSEEARAVRRIVTDDIADVREAIVSLGQRVRLLCIYGGDGTVFRVIGELLERPASPPPMLALLGGGTMNVTAHWCGMKGSPARNFRAVMRAYMTDRLLGREVPLVRVTHRGESAHGFTFGLGPLVRILERYEQATKGHVPALALGARSVAAAVSHFPRDLAPIVKEMSARVLVDGEELPYTRFAALFANITGVINPFVEPFISERSRDTFHFLAYAVSSREFALRAPLLARALLPIDPRSLLRPIATWRRFMLSMVGKGQLPLDPRYINRPARHLTIHTDEAHYTIDGELLPVGEGPIEVRLGPAVRLAVPALRGRSRKRIPPATGGQDLAEEAPEAEDDEPVRSA